MQFVYVGLRTVVSGNREGRRTKAQIWGMVGRSWHVQRCFHNTETTSQGLRSAREDTGWTPDKGLAKRAELSSIYVQCEMFRKGMGVIIFSFSMCVLPQQGELVVCCAAQISSVTKIQ